MQLSAILHPVIPSIHIESPNGSTKNGTVRETKILGAIGNWLYLCT